jgi:tetratricopeptide (TPR) repeat protein
MAITPPLSKILELPGNRAVYERLQAVLKDGLPIAFAGAGASAPLYPLWGQLIEQLAHEPMQQGLATAADEEYWLRNATSKPLLVASQIHARLGDSLYHPFLYETFKDRIGNDGLAYTPAHAALMRANFKAYITTNYDPGLLEARARFRPGSDTGFAVWNQNYQVNRWASGDIFKAGAKWPVLFAHGHFADPPNVVLDRDSYRCAYHDTPYRRLFKNLWFQEHLVFVGFSFGDVTLAQIAEEALWETARQQGGEPRHVAILGLREDQPYTEEMRRESLDDYHAYALFYPVGKTPDGHEDHSALHVLLESLATIPAPAPEPTHAAAPAPPARALPPMLFVHETTEDEKFTGRADILKRLDRCAADPGVRLVAITAIGGLGKTALVGQWLRQSTTAQLRKSEGAFFWSFYRDRETDRFLDALLGFGRDQLGWRPRDDNASPLSQAFDLMESRRLIIALDGLEVIQEAPGTVAYGTLLELGLAEFLHGHCRGRGGSLVVLTSRFPFPDLTQYLGGGLRSLPLPSLTAGEGAALLAALGIGGGHVDREAISHSLEGHPLALRVFARSAPPELRGDPTRLWGKVFDEPHLAKDDSLEGKFQRLLAFYESRLPEAQRDALGVVALFRAPVDEATVALLWEKLLGKTAGNASLRLPLEELRRERLLTSDPGEDAKPRYACHPILRDHFRARILGDAGRAGEAAGLLAGPPDAPKARSIEEIRVIATAIELLLEAGEVKPADDLYGSRLGARVFMTLPAPHLGMEVARGFVRDEARRQALKQISTRRLGFYLNEVALFADIAGEPETALQFYAESTSLHREAGDNKNLSIGLQNLGDVEISLGLLAQAAGHFAEALELAAKIKEEVEERNRLAYCGHAACLCAELERAGDDFARANAIENRIHPNKADLCSLNGVQWAEHLLRTGARDRARRLTEANREICERNAWHEHVARCEWVLGWLDTLDGGWPEAEAHLVRAKATFTTGHMIYELVRVLLTESGCHLGQVQWEAALAACERAMELAAPRKYRLVHADALNLRARISLERPAPDPAGARDDAEAALQLAEFCEYAWAERDACELLARAYEHLGSGDEAYRFRQRADALNRRLGLSSTGQGAYTNPLPPHSAVF